MINNLLTLACIAIALIAFQTRVHADGKISGLMFGDYYYIAKHHRGEEVEDRNGFWFRRIYFTYDNRLTDQFKVRFRIELNQNGDFISQGKMIPVVKDAYLEWMPSKHNSIILGICPTPTWEEISEIWGYRSVEKTPLELHNLGNSRDFGIALLGKYKHITYHLLLGNGSGTDVEINKGKKFHAAFSYEVPEIIFVQAYADYADKSDDKSSYTAQLFLAHVGKKIKAGAHYSYYKFKDDAAHKEQENNIASLFGVYKMNEKIDIFLRYDAMLDPNPKAESIAYIPFDATEKSNLVIAGVSYSPHDSIKIIPNIKYVFYGNDVTSDIYFNVTFFWKF